MALARASILAWVLRDVQLVSMASWSALVIGAVTALLSLALFVFNLLPIPILDGGHLLVFYPIEAILGRPLSPKAFEIATWIGLSLVLMVFAIAFYNDFLRLLR